MEDGMGQKLKEEELVSSSQAQVSLQSKRHPPANSHIMAKQWLWIRRTYRSTGGSPLQVLLMFIPMDMVVVLVCSFWFMKNDFSTCFAFILNVPSLVAQFPSPRAHSNTHTYSQTRPHLLRVSTNQKSRLIVVVKRCQVSVSCHF